MGNHGGDWAGFFREYGRLPLDFSANISPLGMPEGVRQAAAQGVDPSGAYPDPHCRALREALGADLKVDPGEVLCGNGASDLIYRLTLALRPRQTLVTAPCFSEYEAALRLSGSGIRRYPLLRAMDFRLREDFLSWITPETELVFLCQPNNPTGMAVPKELLLKILGACDEKGALLVLDECFLGFLDHPDSMTLLPFLHGHRLLILRAFTKFYGMAGLRLGYCVCEDRDLLGRMAQAGPPWSVSGPAQAAGVAAIRETAYAEALRKLIREQRKVLYNGLLDLDLDVIPGEANFLLFRGAPNLGERLREKGILLRDCRDYHGLEPGWYRAAVRTGGENRKLLHAIKEVQSWQSGS